MKVYSIEIGSTPNYHATGHNPPAPQAMGVGEADKMALEDRSQEQVSAPTTQVRDMISAEVLECSLLKSTKTPEE